MVQHVSGQDPGAVVAGKAKHQQPSQIDRGHPQRPPQLVALDPAVGHPPAAVSDQPGDRSLHHRPPAPVAVLEAAGHRPAPRGAQLILVRVEVDGPATLGGGRPPTLVGQRADRRRPPRRGSWGSCPLPGRGAWPPLHARGAPRCSRGPAAWHAQSPWDLALAGWSVGPHLLVEGHQGEEPFMHVLHSRLLAPGRARGWLSTWSAFSGGLFHLVKSRETSDDPPRRLSVQQDVGRVEMATDRRSRMRASRYVVGALYRCRAARHYLAPGPKGSPQDKVDCRCGYAAAGSTV